MRVRNSETASSSSQLSDGPVRSGSLTTSVESSTRSDDHPAAGVEAASTVRISEPVRGWRVALLPSSYAPNLGGVEELTSRLAGELTRRGARVLVVTNRWPHDLPAQEVLDTIPVRRVVFVGPGSGIRPMLRFGVGFPVALFEVVRSLRRLEPDVVHVQCVSVAALYAWLGARLLRTPLVVSLQGELTMDAHQVYQRSRFLRWLLRRLLRHADAVTACSTQTLTEAEQAMRIETGERGTVIYNGVDLEEFEQPAADRAADRYILGIGRHVPEKGFDVLIRAFAQLDRDDVRLVVAGDGPELPALGKLAAELGIAERVELPGRTDRARTVELFHGCELFVLPSRHEPFGIVNVEAMASGKAIVATNVGGVPELVEDGVNGVLAPAGDPVALAGAIRRLLDDDDLRRRLGDAGRRRVRDFAWQVIARQYTSVYRSVTRHTNPAVLDDAGGRPRFRVAYVGHTAVASGGELALVRLLGGLSDVEPHVLLGADGPLVTQLKRRGVEVEVLPLDPRAGKVARQVVRPGRLPLAAVLATVRYVWRLSRRLKELDPDIVHTNTLKAAVYGGLAGRLARVPVVWHIRDRIAPDYLPRSAVIAVRLLARFVPAAIIANSQATRRTLGRPRRLIAVVPSPVVYDAVEPEDWTGDPPEGPLVVGIVGRLAAWKGQDVFVRAFAEAFPEGDERALIVGGALFGEDDYATELLALVDELGLSERVELTGHVDDVPAQLERMHLVVHASVLPEPFGQVVVEAMAAGRAVIASAEGGPLEIIRSGVDGVLVAPGDVAALAEAMRRLATDPQERDRLGQAARASVERFAPERVGRQVEDVYRAVSRHMKAAWQSASLDLAPSDEHGAAVVSP